MKKGTTFWRILVVILFLTGSYGRLSAQASVIPLQQLIIRDKLLENNLKGFIRETHANVVLITLDRREKAYIYKLESVDWYNDIAWYASDYWGQWWGHLCLFHTGPEFNDVCSITRPVPLVNLKNYLRSALPDRIEPVVLPEWELPPGTKVIKLKAITTKTGERKWIRYTEWWIFKVEDGREIYWYDNLGNETSEPPPAPPSRN